MTDPCATFRFYDELNDFLPADRKHREIAFQYVVPPTVKDAMESLGVPHVEVELILVNGGPVGFEYRLADGDRVGVYSACERLDIGSAACLRPRYQAPHGATFVADVHLRKLSRLLRLLGFDTAWSTTATDSELARTSAAEGRILLTRDRQLLKRRSIAHGTWIRSTDAIEQVCEVIRRFELRDRVTPFSRCIVCNGVLQSVDRSAVSERIPPRTAGWLNEYSECSDCRKLYWRGTHIARLQASVDRILRETATQGAASPPSASE